MRLEVYHQLGCWEDRRNFASLRKDGTGDGVILSPKNMSKSKVESELDEKLSERIREATIFDPQFFIPKLTGAEADTLSTYGFAPIHIKTIRTETRVEKRTGKEKIVKIKEGSFAPDKFTPQQAEECVDFQFRNNSRYFVIPTQYPEGIDIKEFITSQRERFVVPSREAIRKMPVTKEVFLQLVLPKATIKGAQLEQIKTWVTGERGIDGIYLIVSPSTDSAQIKDVPFLSAWLEFIHLLVNKGLKVILGYLDIEVLLLSIASPSIVTMGATGTTRRFYKKKPAGGAQKGTKRRPKFYLPKLLQWIHYGSLKPIVSVLSDQKDFFEGNRYQHVPKSRRPTQRDAYMFNALAFYNQLDRIRNLEGPKRYNEVRSMITTAIDNYDRLEKHRPSVELKRSSQGYHLEAWLQVVDKFAKAQRWR